jgi:hypothetical protein
MKPIHLLLPVSLFSLLTLSSTVLAQVYKCTDAGGTVSYSESPCAKSAKSQQLNQIEAVSTAPPSATRNWRQENEDFRQRQQARDDQDNADRANWRARNAANQAQTQKKQNDQRLIANCEANHGARCSDPGTVNQMRRENTPITKAEQQRAIAERKARENNW